MATRMKTPPVRRPSLPLTERDERDLTQLRQSADLGQLLARLSGQPVGNHDVSESVLLHAVFSVGLAAIRKAIEEQGYTRIAAEQAAESAQRRAEARRRLPTWAEES